jgi:hypothetical protein
MSGGKEVSHGYLNQYSYEGVIEAEKLQLRIVTRLLKDHPALWGWNLGNEPRYFRSTVF